MLNIVFMGTPDFARDSLRALVENNYNILTVVTNPDKPKGRGMKMILSPVKEYAESQNLMIEQPVKIRDNIEFIDKLKKLNPDLICVVAYGKIIPEEILNIPRLGCINVHGSLLPKYRGAAPIQWAVINGEKETGITTMYMDKGMDTGDMILKEKVEIWDRLSKIGAELLVKTVKLIEDRKAPREKQGDDFTLAPMLKKEMAKLDFENKTAEEIKNLIRGLNPIMGAYTYKDGKMIKFWKAVSIDEENINIDDLENALPGTVVKSNEKEGLFIKTKKGILSVLEIQGENSKRMNIKDFLRGNKIEEGYKF